MMKIGQKILGRYKVDDLICEGGQASVARGIDLDTGQAVAIRQLVTASSSSGYQQAVARFQREGALRIGHPNVVDPIECGEDDDAWYTVAPFIDGRTLELHVAQSGGRLRASEATRIISAIAAGLGTGHAKGVVHRDVKPANILIAGDGTPHLIDFGICSVAGEPTLTRGTGFQGSLHWTAPEQILDPACRDRRADLYALGATFYYALTGEAPVRGDTVEQIMLSICQWTPPPPRQVDRSIPSSIDQACMRLLEKQPERRFQDATELIHALVPDAEPFRSASSCPSCNGPVESHSKFCGRCGAGLMEASTVLRCLACGAEAGEGGCCSGCHLLFSPSDHRLTFESGPLRGTTFRVPEGIYEVGREVLAPRDYRISRRHLQVACVNGTVHVADAGSVNRTYVNGKPVEGPTPLVARCELALAGNRAVYSSNPERNR